MISEEINKLLKEREIEKINENKKKEIQTQKKENNKNHSFLQEEKYNNDKKNIPLKYRRNILTCKDLTEIEGIVYETPDNKENPEENNPKLYKYFKDLYSQAKCKLPKNISKKIKQIKDISINDTYYLKNNLIKNV